VLSSSLMMVKKRTHPCRHSLRKKKIDLVLIIKKNEHLFSTYYLFIYLTNVHIYISRCAQINLIKHEYFFYQVEIYMVVDLDTWL
jgi:hypothetical protein